MIKQICFLLITLSLLSCNNTPPVKSTTHHRLQVLGDSLTLAIAEMGANEHFNGFAVALVDSSGIVYEKGFGWADIEDEVAYSARSLQPIASVSKTLIGLSLLEAREMDLLKLDDTINQYLPFEVRNPNFPDQPITLRHLATHSSGILDNEAYNAHSYVLLDDLERVKKDFESFPDFFSPREEGVSMEEFLRRYLSPEGEWYEAAAFSQHSPGARYEYSNVGATLAAYIVERVSGMSYREFSRTHILQHLGMEDSRWIHREADTLLMSTLYGSVDEALPGYRLITYPDGGLITSAHDLGLYLSELIRGYHGQGTLLSAESYKELFRGQLAADCFAERDPDNPYDDEYQTGIFMGFSGKGNIGHTGGDPGVATMMFFDPATGLGRVLICNTDIRNRDGGEAFYGLMDVMEDVAGRILMDEGE